MKQRLNRLFAGFLIVTMLLGMSSVAVWAEEDPTVPPTTPPTETVDPVPEPEPEPEQPEEIDPETCEHQFGPWVVQKAATTSSKGYEIRTCEICKVATEGRDIPVQKIRNTWVCKSGKWYYYNSAGNIAIKASKYKKKWVNCDGRTFYITAKHVPYGQGFHYIKKKLYYMDASRAVVKSRTFNAPDGVSCYANSKGCISGAKLYQYKKKTFVYVDISDQKLIFFKKGKAKWSCRVITGKPGASRTPTGTFSVKKKFTNARLVGPTWDKRVKYWIAFIRNEYGFHDTLWRDDSDFNSAETYLENGSEGCVNMRYYDVQRLYKAVKKGTPVIIAN